MECGDYGVGVAGGRVKTAVMVGRGVPVIMIGIG